MTPQQIWRNSSLSKIPKLHVKWLTQAFVAMVSEMSLNEVVDPLHESSLQALLSKKKRKMKNIQMRSKMRRRVLLRNNPSILLMKMNSHCFISQL
jgi:hypothetical protein